MRHPGSVCTQYMVLGKRDPYSRVACGKLTFHSLGSYGDHYDSGWVKIVFLRRATVNRWFKPKAISCTRLISTARAICTTPKR